MIARHQLMRVLTKYAGSSLTPTWLDKMADEILKLEGGGQHAAEEGQEPQGGQLEHQDRDEGRQAEEAGGGDRAAQGGQEPEEVTDSGTMFPELPEVRYAKGYHHPSGRPAHRLEECNRMGCGPAL